MLALNGLRISEALNADIEDLSTERGHRTLAIVRKGSKHVTIPIAPRTGRALDLYIGDRTMGPIFLDVQEAASHADPRTTMRYDRARRSLDRHATYIVSTFVAGATRQS